MSAPTNLYAWKGHGSFTGLQGLAETDDVSFDSDAEGDHGDETPDVGLDYHGFEGSR
jgi:hypothetical protein